MQDTEPYFYTLQSTMSRILRHLPEMHSPYFAQEEEQGKRTKAYIVVTADKGMAGAYNHNVIKHVNRGTGKDDFKRFSPWSPR